MFGLVGLGWGEAGWRRRDYQTSMSDALVRFCCIVERALMIGFGVASRANRCIVCIEFIIIIIGTRRVLCDDRVTDGCWLVGSFRLVFF